MAKIFALVFGLLYLLSFGAMMRFDSSEFRSVDKVCATYVVDKVEALEGGRRETGHYENRNESCFFFFGNIVPIAFVIALFPFLFMVGMSGMGCSGAECAVSPAVYTIAVIASVVLYSSIGFGLGTALSILMSRRSN